MGPKASCLKKYLIPIDAVLSCQCEMLGIKDQIQYRPLYQMDYCGDMLILDPDHIFTFLLLNQAVIDKLQSEQKLVESP